MKNMHISMFIIFVCTLMFYNNAYSMNSHEDTIITIEEYVPKSPSFFENLWWNRFTATETQLLFHAFKIETIDHTPYYQTLAQNVIIKCLKHHNLFALSSILQELHQKFPTTPFLDDATATKIHNYIKFRHCIAIMNVADSLQQKHNRFITTTKKRICHTNFMIKQLKENEDEIILQHQDRVKDLQTLLFLSNQISSTKDDTNLAGSPLNQYYTGTIERFDTAVLAPLQASNENLLALLNLHNQ